jgi:hypothetical protein
MARPLANDGAVVISVTIPLEPVRDAFCNSARTFNQETSYA